MESLGDVTLATILTLVPSARWDVSLADVSHRIQYEVEFWVEIANFEIITAAINVFVRAV